MVVINLKINIFLKPMLMLIRIRILTFLLLKRWMELRIFISLINVYTPFVTQFLWQRWYFLIKRLMSKILEPQSNEWKIVIAASDFTWLWKYFFVLLPEKLSMCYRGQLLQAFLSQMATSNVLLNVTLFLLVSPLFHISISSSFSWWVSS